MTHAAEVYDFYKPNRLRVRHRRRQALAGAYLTAVDRCWAGLKAKLALARRRRARRPPRRRRVRARVPALAVQQARPEGLRAAAARRFCRRARPARICGARGAKVPSAASTWQRRHRPRGGERVPRRGRRTVQGDVRAVGHDLARGGQLLHRRRLHEPPLARRQRRRRPRGEGRPHVLVRLGRRRHRLHDPRARASGANALHGGEPFTAARIGAVADVAARLAARDTLGVADFNAAMDLRAERYGTAGWTPSGPLDALFPGTYYLAEVDALHRRTYART